MPKPPPSCAWALWASTCRTAPCIGRRRAMREEDGLGPSTTEKEAEPVSHTVRLLNTGASTNRRARVTLRGLMAALLIGCRCFIGLAHHRDERERRRKKGAHNGATVACRRPAARFSRCGVVKRKRKEGNEHQGSGSKPTAVLFSRESRTVVRSELTVVVVRAKLRPMWARNTVGQDVIQIS
jgi:hypothetical protein